jgi:threonine aldolase
MNWNESDFPFGLGSDNHSGVHPQILEAITNVNLGFAPSYGTDSVTRHTEKMFRNEFGSADVYFCFNGTAANVLSIGALLDRHESVLCSHHAHLAVDECGAPESLLGCKLVLISTASENQAKISPELIEPFLIRRGDQHFSQPRLVSITQPTELGTLYSKEELHALRAFCDSHNLWLHVDGARLTNAAARLGSLRDSCLGADVVSFGGTKNGLMFGEAVLILSPKAKERAKNFSYLRKQMMQLPSKTRFIAAQFARFLENGLWRELAEHSLKQAHDLRTGLEEAASLGAEIHFTQPTQSNAVFAIFGKSLEKALKEEAFFYIWDEHSREARLMTSWCTTESQIQKVIKRAKEIGRVR